MNTKLIRQVADTIEAHPETYDQGTWGWAWQEIDQEHALPCGTAACVAGHICASDNALANDLMTEEGGVRETARRLADVPEELSEMLFSMCWPWWWFKRAGRPGRAGNPGTIVPGSKDAPVILRWLADCWDKGEVDEVFFEDLKEAD